MILKPRRVWAGRQTKELNAMAKDTKAAGGCLWEAGKANLGGNYVLLFMEMA